MGLPRTREEFKGYILRKLGSPVINIEVDELQIEDRIDDALQLYRDYHYLGHHKIYYKHQVTEEDIANRYIVLPDYIISVTEMFDIGNLTTSTTNIFSLRYQLVQQELYTLLANSLVPYYTAFSQIAMLQELLVGKKPVRFNKHINKCYIDMNWNEVQEGEYIILDAYAYTDPADFPDVWTDGWLLRYATALVKLQWGQNISKYQNVVMAGGVTLSGAEIYSQAENEISALREELEKNSPLVYDFIG